MLADQPTKYERTPAFISNNFYKIMIDWLMFNANFSRISAICIHVYACELYPSSFIGNTIIKQ
jgi:hypothetical protein